jgi:CubicO group peptidase (beta-lactamase class C family)
LITLLSLTSLPGQTDPLAGLDNYIIDAMDDWRVPGLAIAIVNRDSVIYAKGYGVQDITTGEPVDEHTLFAIASLSKAYTATAIGMLVHEGKLDWDDQVIEYLPQFHLNDPAATAMLNIKDLMGHKAGYRAWEGDLVWWGSDYSRDEILRRYKYLEAPYSFRSRYGYNNILYLAAGQLIPALTGISWDDYIDERILNPLNMRRTTTHVTELKQLGNVAMPHMLVDDEVIPIPYRDLDNIGPAAALNSSAWEAAQWIKLQLAYGNYDGVQVVDSSIILATRTPQTTIPVSQAYHKLFPSTHFRAYGMGWYMRDYQGSLMIRHGGGMDGMRSNSGFMPERNLGVVVLTNYEDQSLTWALYIQIFDRFLGVEEHDWSEYYLKRYKEDNTKAAREKSAAGRKRAKKTKPSLQLDAYTGQYENDFYGTASVTLKGRKLVLKLDAHKEGSAQLNHWEYDRFKGDWQEPTWLESDISFSIDGSRQVESISVAVRDYVDPKIYIFMKVD